MKKTVQIGFIACFLLFLAAVAVLTALNFGETVSDTENRSLAKKPELSRDSFLSGDYFAESENFLIDHAAARAVAVKMNTFAEVKLLRLPVVNDIYISDNYLLPVSEEKYFVYPDIPASAQKTAAELASLQSYAISQGAQFLYAGVPSQFYYYRDTVPDCFARFERDTDEVSTAFFSALDAAGVNYLDVDAVYEAQGRPKEYFTVTDHHFSFAGAFSAYSAIMEKLNTLTGLDAPVLTAADITEKTLPNPFSGSRNREILGLFETDDKQTVGLLNTPVAYKRWDNGEETDGSMLVLPATESETVTYGVFMGADYAETIVKTNRPQLPKILVYGDSFTNALETLLYASFDEMRALDLRHYTEKSLRDYIAEYQPDIVLCVRDCTMYLDESGNGQT